MDIESSSNEQHKFIETSTETQWIPSNCAIRIFSFLSRDELETARLVCRTWNSLITGTGQRNFQKRQINTVEISSNSEYSAKIYYRDHVKLLTFKKYFSFCDLSTVEDRAYFKIIGSKQYQYPCTHFFRGDAKLNARFKFSARTNAFRGKYCNHRKFRIYNKKVTYKSKIFTPSLDFYVRLQWMLKDSSVKYLVFIDFAFTELFVEKFEEYFGSNYEVHKIFIHNCSLKHIGVSSFHRFIGKIVKAKEYHFELLKNALPNHINDSLLLSPNLLEADVVLISGATGRHARFDEFGGFGGGIVHFNVTQTGFNEYIKQRKDLKKEKPNSVFGIQYSLANDQQLIADYTQEFKYEGGLHLFKFVLFGQFRFVAPNSDFEVDPAPIVVPALQNFNVDMEDEEDDEADSMELAPKQHIKLLKYSVFENNQLKDPDVFNIFKQPLPIVS